MNYEEMSDYQINKRVFPYTRNFGKCEDVQAKPNPNRSDFMWGDGCNWFTFNPCSNPSDAWPIIFENLIEISPPVHPERDAYWFASNIHLEGVIAKDKNPLRAAMIYFLKMKDSQHD